jgi:hypothetical protein
MVERFQRDEAGYADWRATHPEGFAFNNFGGRQRAYNILHRVACSFLSRECDHGARTTCEKLCSDDIDSLIAIAEEVRAGTEGWKECGICKPISSRTLS